jgi:hypothetical protein
MGTAKLRPVSGKRKGHGDQYHQCKQGQTHQTPFKRNQSMHPTDRREPCQGLQAVCAMTDHTVRIVRMRPLGWPARPAV